MDDPELVWANCLCCIQFIHSGTTPVVLWTRGKASRPTLKAANVLLVSNRSANHAQISETPKFGKRASLPVKDGTCHYDGMPRPPWLVRGCLLTLAPGRGDRTRHVGAMRSDSSAYAILEEETND